MDVPETDLVATQEFNGGIIFVSYVISVVGAQTTLELLSRRTHIRGLHNWFLLGAAALSMGGVAIWSMHFIGNNSLTLMFDGNIYHLNYSAGYTFASLVVAIAVMFLAFAFVGITEEAEVIRIIPSGTIAGIGIAVMHYLGQFAIDFFHLTYKIEYIAGAVIIAVAAVNVALYIFFKLRENWTNQWYKRLGSALLMGIAVCGMHYTAMAGTEYRLPPHQIPPTPALSRAGLIGIISAIVVVACVLLLSIAVKSGVVHLPMAVQQAKNERLFLDVVFFDRNGRILVNLDGTVPMKEVLGDIHANSSNMEFTVSNPLFLRLFDVTTKWTRRNSSFSDRPSEQSSTRTNDPHDLVESLFLDAARELAHELRLPSLGELGTMFDDIIKTNTIAKPRTGFWNRRKAKDSSKSSSDGSSTMLRETTKTSEIDENNDKNGKDNHRKSSNNNNNNNNRKSHRFSRNFHVDKKPPPMKRVYSDSTFDNATILEEGTLPHGDTRRISQTSLPNGREQNNRDRDMSHKNISRPPSATTERLSSQDDIHSEDRHIFLVKRIDKKELTRLLALGYRFAEATFISRTMGDYLQIPTDHMSIYFADMRHMALSVPELMQQKYAEKQLPHYPNRHSTTIHSPVTGTSSSLAESSSAASVSSDNDPIPESATRGAVYLGLSVLVHEDKEHNPHNIHIIVDKKRRHAFPMVQLQYEDGEVPVTLAPEERNCVLSLHGQSLQNMCSLESHIQLPRESGSTLVGGRQSSDWATASDTTSATFVTSTGSPPDFGGASPISSGNIFSPTSPSSTRGVTLTTRFTRALELSCQKLVDLSSYGKPLASVAKLHGEVVDIPPFGLTMGPCQLILFRAWVTIPGTISAINQTLTENIKCVPLPLYRSLAYHITDQAVIRYRAVTMRSVPESTYLVQQRVYQSTAAVSAPSPAASKPAPPSSPLSRNHDITSGENSSFSYDNRNSTYDDTSNTPTLANSSLIDRDELEDIKSPTSPPSTASNHPQLPSNNTSPSESNRTSVLAPLPSLPPPPRTRRPKLQFPAASGLSLLSLESLADKRAASQQSQIAPSVTSIELPTILTILPTQDRFWWLNSMIDEIMHGY
ncbi:hypothetical protein BDA99DRAFT_523777 [Phascolomyces articulosus]|uniref:MHYT domain-containing protein n=1 Tax=Phascolomyces articulosus TaxID=60185 RepID=A0AAD5K0G6_9FUNG|nr:hypothetical protein BDA99DRAFT_523777 [Phascolomyces articulosus]